MKVKKGKRTKVECLTCGSVFDDDYKTRHEIKKHAGKSFGQAFWTIREYIYSHRCHR